MTNAEIFQLILVNAPKTSGAAQQDPAAACECVVRTKSGHMMQGVLTAHYDSFKIAVPSMIGDPAQPNNSRAAKKVIAEHFFSSEVVESIIFLRPVDENLVRGIDRPPLIIPQ